MKSIYTLLFLAISFVSLSQGEETLTPEERAYLFHIVKKSPILDHNFGRYFDYKGPDIRLANKEINYDSVELVIINHPEMLVIRKEEIAKSAPGLIAEAANKMAIWELNKILLASRGNEKDLEPYMPKYRRFTELLLAELPPAAVKSKEGVAEVHPKVLQALNPGLSFDEKVAFLESQRFLSENDCEVTLNAINKAVNGYVEQRAFEIFRQMGGRSNEFDNRLIAAGDGSLTSGLLEEREKDEKGRWNKGLPRAIGLFPYQFVRAVEDGKPKIEPRDVATLDFKTAGDNRITNLHFDVWGYNSEKQTTVVVERNGQCYRLFGSGETRFLSPDSAFGGGKTYQTVMDELEFGKIAQLTEMIYGKKGFDYQIEYNTKKKDETELKIEKNEKKNSDFGYTPISTSSKSSRKVKKARKKNRGGGPVDYQPTTNSNKKKRGNKQSEIVSLYNQYDHYKGEIARLEQEKAEAIDLLATYQRKLDLMKLNFGVHPVAYTVTDGMYLFEDSVSFDLLTQEFRFPKSVEKESFEVRLVSVPYSPLSDQADEVMLHINKTAVVPGFDARVNLQLVDVFGSNSYELERPLFQQSDSVAVLLFFEALQDKKLDFEVIARGQGVGQWDSVLVTRDPEQPELSAYPSISARNDSAFVRLRRSDVLITIDRKNTLEVNSYTDPVRTSFQPSDEEARKMQQEYGLSGNELLSVYRTAEILVKLRQELNVLAGTYLDRETAKAVIDRLNKVLDQARISVGRTSVKLSDLKI